MSNNLPTAKNPERLIIFTKEPVSLERIEAVERLSLLEEFEIVAVVIEEAMHLPLHTFLLRTLKRIHKGYIYLPEFLGNLFTFLTAQKQGDVPLETRLDIKHISVVRVKNVQSKNSIKILKQLKPDWGLIIGHRILPEKVFSIPKHGTLNVHHGILPRYAGSHTTFWRLVEGHRTVGITIHKVSAKVDSGDILLIKKAKVKSQSAAIAYQKVLTLVPSAVVEALLGLSKQSLSFVAQDPKQRKIWKPPTYWERIKYKKYL